MCSVAAPFADMFIHFLQVISSEEVELRLRDSATQALLVPVGDEEFQYEYVVMPMRLS